MAKERTVSWVSAAAKAFRAFPDAAQIIASAALYEVAAGQTPEIAKPMKGMTEQVFELAIKHRRDAYRVVYAVQIGDAIWVLHAFQKKSKTGIATPKKEIDLIRARIKTVKDQLP